MQYIADFYRRKGAVSLRVAHEVVIWADDHDDLFKRLETLQVEMGATQVHVKPVCTAGVKRAT